jgi:hypothetical protein
MIMNENKIEQEIQAKGLNAPRLTPDLIESVIASEQYWQPEGTTLTVCALALANGTQVVGESACVSPANFDAEIGRKIARDNAKQKVWALEGYLLKQKLHESSNDALPNGLDRYQLGDRVVAIYGAINKSAQGVVEVIRSAQSVGVRLDDGSLWHEHSAHWAKA